MPRPLFLTFALLLLAGLGHTSALADSIEDAATDELASAAALHAGYHLEIDKSDRRLRLKNADRVFREYPVSWGRGGPGDKQFKGDNKTPVGIYRIVGFNDNSKFHLFMRLNYPNVKDAFYGLKNDVITRGEFDRIIDSLKNGRLPPQNTRLGGAIGIHGVGEENAKKLKIHSKMNWTEGCLALTNEEIAELRNYVSVGTEVVIRE